MIHFIVSQAWFTLKFNVLVEDYWKTTIDANGTCWTMDTREEFVFTLPDETLKRLGVALGLNVTHPHVEVVLARYVGRTQCGKGTVTPPPPSSNLQGVPCPLEP